MKIMAVYTSERSPLPLALQVLPNRQECLGKKQLNIFLSIYSSNPPLSASRYTAPCLRLLPTTLITSVSSSRCTHLKSGIPLAVLTPAPLSTTTCSNRRSFKSAAISPTEPNLPNWVEVDRVFSNGTFADEPLRNDLAVNRRGSRGRM